MVLRSEVIPSELLRSFLVIQRTGSYSEAGEMLGLSQPAISSHMKRLQLMIGGDLFERGPGGLHLTAKGEIVEGYASRILNLNWQMLRLCGAGEGKRTFRIGIQKVFSATHFVHLQQSLERRLPEQRSVITWGSAAELYDGVRTGYLDAAFIAHSFTSAHQLDNRWEEKMCWVCSRNFVLGETRPIPLLSAPGSLSDVLAIAALSHAGASYSVVNVASDLTTQLIATRAGLGVFILPERLVPSDLKIADFHYLPILPSVASGIYVNEAISEAEAQLLGDVIGDVMPPNAPLGPTAAS